MYVLGFLEMDRSWMYGKRNTLEFVEGVNEFCKRAVEHQQLTCEAEIYCPCVDCYNVNMISDIRTIRDHLIRRGFRAEYYIWLWHGEQGKYTQDRVNVDVGTSNSLEIDMSNVGVENEVVIEDHVRIEGDDVVGDENDNGDNSDIEDEEFGDRLGEMLEGARDHFNERPRVFDSLSEAAGKPLYPWCTKYTQLSGVLTRFNIKAKHNLTDVGFTELLEALHDMFPEGNLLPKSTYYAKKKNVSFGFGI